MSRHVARCATYCMPAHGSDNNAILSLKHPQILNFEPVSIFSSLSIVASSPTPSNVASNTASNVVSNVASNVTTRKVAQPESAYEYRSHCPSLLKILS